MMRRSNRRWVVLFIMLLLGLGGGIWWRNHRTSLRAVALVHGDTLVDLAEVGVLIVDGGDIVLYDWNGRQQARYRVASIPWGREPRGAGWKTWQAEWFNEWPAPDASTYREYSRPPRTFASVRKLARFSPKGRYVGILAYQTGQLDISVWQGQTISWQMTLPLSPQGPVTGAIPVDLVVSESGHVILYTSGTPIHPLAEVNDGTVRTTRVQQAFASLVQDYIHALAPHPISWTHGLNPQDILLSQSADGRFILVDQEYSLKLDRYLLRLTPYAGRTHLTVREYPGIKRGERWGFAQPFDDRWLLTVPFTGKRDFKLAVDNRPYFAPDGRHLIFRNWYEGWFGICQF